MADKIITIFADFGNGPYAWIKDGTDKTRYVGACAASVGWLSGEFRISSDLQKDFEEWITHFEMHYDTDGFDWKDFNTRGITLSRRLKAEVGSRFAVQYCKPHEDPGRGN